MEDLLYVALTVLGIVVVVGVVLGLYLAKHAIHVSEDEEYEYEAYFDEKWNQNGPDKGK